MGCTQSKGGNTALAGPRAVVSSQIPDGKGMAGGAHGDADVVLKKKQLHNKQQTDDTFGSSTSDQDEAKDYETADEEEGEDENGIDVDVEHIDLVGQLAEVNGDRRRLSIMKSDEYKDPRKVRTRSRGSSASSTKSLELADPGQDIGNGAFGENGDHSKIPLVYSCVTRPGNDPAKRQKENQDTYCVHNRMDRDEHMFVACVFDGHGPNGALASNYVRDRLIKTWSEMGLGRPHCQDEDEIRRILHNGCVEVNHKLATSSIDVYVSGSTGILGVIKKDMLYVANVGDSRAVLGRVGPNGRIHHVDLSNDQKPDRPDEHARIIRYGGRVFEWGVPRVWQRNVDMPGLAMARSFGDLAAESVGVFAEPEITCTKLTSNDKFLIFATDGVWEFLSSSDIVKIIGKHTAKKPPHVAARDASIEVIKTSVAKWNAVEDVVDDATCVIIALDY